MPSAPLQSVREELSDRFNSEIAPPPPTYSINRMRSGASQTNELTEAFRPCVRFCTSRPSADMVNKSPPWNPSSLIKPSTNAIDLPSGDQRATATWREGL